MDGFIQNLSWTKLILTGLVGAIVFIAGISSWLERETEREIKESDENSPDKLVLREIELDESKASNISAKNQEKPLDPPFRWGAGTSNYILVGLLLAIIAGSLAIIKAICPTC